MNRPLPRTLATFAAVLCALVAGTAPAGVFNMGPGLTNLDMVTVGNPGNAPDKTGFGAVDYTYAIGKYEVTNAQYAVFLNAVATDDQYNVYNNRLMINFDESTQTYTVEPGWENRPVLHVNWGSAARFVNWLHHGQPTGVQDESTTEDGAYTLDGAMTHAQLIQVERNSGARYWLPSENEWYKAAYYDPTLNGGLGGYWKYPTQSNTIEPTWANYSDSEIWEPTDVGSYAGHASAYGTFDQGGNVREWTETKRGNDAHTRGGWYNSWYAELEASAHSYKLLNGRATECLGFRIASPEPGGIVALIGMAAVGLLWSWRRR